MAQRKRCLSPEAYTVGWVCALSIELAAAAELLDEEHQDLRQGARDTNLYTLGRIGEHNVVIACLPAGQTGTNSAATVVVQMKLKFVSLRFGLMVGIGGGVPSDEADIRLGDVVISQPYMEHGGVVQYDFGKTTPNGFVRTGFLNTPPTILLNALSRLRANHHRGRSHLSTYLSSICLLPSFSREKAGPDILFESTYDHVRGLTCETCDNDRILERTSREIQEVMVYYGTIASGNQVIRDGVTRDKLSSELGGVLCFEMEAAGLMNFFPCLVIRGICDYADSHKNKRWQPYAAATAAACAKEVLSVIPAAEVTTTPTVDEAIKSLTQEMLQSDIDTMNLDVFLPMLSAVDQDEHRSTIPSLNCDQEEFFWVFRNIDFKRWSTANYSQVLWLSGPPERNIHQVSSYIVDQEKSEVLKTQNFALYFFCSTAIIEKSILVVFVHTLLHQIVSCPPIERGILIVRGFLHFLLEGIFKKEAAPNWEQQDFKKKDSLDTNIKKILDAPAHELWAALEFVLGDEQQRQLSVVVDGLDKIKHQKSEFIREVRTFIEHLQKSTLKVKALLTSQPQTEIKELLDGLLCIECDKERKVMNKECLASLHFNNARYDKISKEHEGSLEWIWTHKEYTNWSAAKVSRLLYIQGKPGSGKSTLTKYFNERLLEREPTAKSAIIAKFFYSYREGEVQRSHYNMIRSILYDILNQNEAFFYHRFQTEYRRLAALRERGHSDQEYESFKKLLLSLSDHSPAKRLYLIIDAVDESDDNDRRDILELLFDLCSQTKYCVVKVFVASRPVALLDRNISNFHFIRLQDHTKSDISNFARYFLNRLEFTGFLERAAEYIVENAQGVFLWVQLVGEELLAYDVEGCAEEEVFEFLQSLPTELEGFYELMLNKIGRKSADFRDGIKMLRFVLFARRPLSVSELLHALGIRDILDDLSDERFIKRIPPERRIIHSGGHFLEIREHQRNRSVQVMHQTVREFFLRSNGYVANTKFRISEEDAHSCISITCIQYLILCAASITLAKRPPDIKSWTSKHYEDYVQYLDGRPLANYALCYLKHHIDGCRQDADVIDVTSQFIDALTHSPVVYLLESWVSLHLNKTLLSNGEGGAAEDFRDKLLHTAVRKGFTTAVEVLLTVGANVNAKGKLGRTPLSCAVEEGHEAVVRLLLAHSDVEADSKDKYSRTPLWRAAEGGHEALVRLLLARSDVEVDLKDDGGRTPLWRAAERGHEAVVRLLLEKGANPDSKDRQGRTVLFPAAENGHDAVMRLLLDKGADLDSTYRHGWTAMLWRRWT